MFTYHPFVEIRAVARLRNGRHCRLFQAHGTELLRYSIFYGYNSLFEMKMTKYVEDFRVYIGRMREILREAQELSAHLEIQSAKLAQCEERVYAGKQARGVGVLSVDTMQLLEDEFDLITDLHYANGAKMDELDIEMAYTKSVIHEILADASRDLAMWEGSDEVYDKSQCGGECPHHVKKSDR